MPVWWCMLAFHSDPFTFHLQFPNTIQSATMACCYDYGCCCFWLPPLLPQRSRPCLESSVIVKAKRLLWSNNIRSGPTLPDAMSLISHTSVYSACVAMSCTVELFLIYIKMYHFFCFSSIHRGLSLMVPAFNSSFLLPLGFVPSHSIHFKFHAWIWNSQWMCA